MRIITFDDRILGISLKAENKDLLLLNLYLTYYSDENLHEYLMYIGRLCSITKDYDSIEIVIMSDFNANLDYVYFAEWRTACEQYSLTFSDVSLLPSDTFTHLNNGSFSKRCLDHILSSQSVHMSILS